MTARSFEVNFQTTPPRPSRTAFKRRQAGTLQVFDNRAELRPRSGDPVHLTNVSSVARGWKDFDRGQWLAPIVDTWIEVHFDDHNNNPQVVYVNDRRWFGWASLLLRNRRLLKALTSLTHR